VILRANIGRQMKNKRDWDLEKSEKKIDPKRIILNDAMP